MSPAMRFVLPALAAASTAYASCSVSGTTTLQNSGDATALATCTNTFSGSIAIATGTSDPINLDGIKVIDGDLTVANNSAITTLTGDSLQEITGTFNLNDVQVLSTVTFNKLTTVNKIVWNALPNLQNPSFSAPITKVSSVDIENTQLQSLSGLNLVTADTITVVNNPYINSISMQLGNVTTALTLSANGPQLNVSFPNMEWAYNLTFRNCSSINVPSLETLNGSMGFYGNQLTSFAAANLTKVGGALAFVSNTELTNISLPTLSEVDGSLQIANNTKLSGISLSQLKTVGGAVDFYGNFTEVDLPALGDVKGAFNIQSSGNLDCSTFQSDVSKKVIKGKYFCQGSVANPGGAGTTPTATGNGAKKTGAASALNVEAHAALGLAGLAAAFFL